MALFVNGCHYLSASAVIAELAEIDSLPCAHIELSACNRDSQADSEEGTLGMRRHVIRAFHCVFVIWFPLLYHVVQYGFHVCADIWIVVLVDGQRT